MALGDLVWVVAAPFVTLWLREPALLGFGAQGQIDSGVFEYVLINIICALLMLVAFRIGDSMAHLFSVDDLKSVCLAATATSSLSAAIAFTVNRLDTVPRSTPVIYALVLALGLAGLRLASRIREPYDTPVTNFAAAAAPRRVLLIGVDRFSSQVIRLVDCQARPVVQFVAALDPRDRLMGRTVHGVKIVGAPEDLGAVLDEYAVHGIGVDEIWMSDEIAESPKWAKGVMSTTASAGVSCQPTSRALNLEQIQRESLAVQSRGPKAITPSGYLSGRRWVDAVLATLLLFALSPVILTFSALVYFDVGFPLIFWQERIGWRGGKFLLFKFRTYRAPFDRAGNQVASEVRLSSLGTAIRASRLDEIPQLFNIVKGDMAIIGPRPLLPIDQPPDPELRLLARPGVTGWAQINGGTLLTPDEKDAMDVWYIRHASLWFDLQVIWHTLRYFRRGQVRNESAIEQAIRWRRKTDYLDAMLFSDRNNRTIAVDTEGSRPRSGNAETTLA